MARDAQQERVQDVRARYGRPDGRDGERSGAFSRSLQEVAAGHGRGHAGRDLAGVLCPLLDCPAAIALAARARIVRQARRSDLCRPGGRRTTAWSRGTRRSAALADRAEGNRPRAQFLLRQRPLVERSGIRAAAPRARVRHQQRQQLLVLLPPGERCRSGSEPRIGHGHRAARRTSRAAISSC